MLPTQLLPPDGKTLEWCKNNVNRLCRMVGSSGDAHSKDALCYKLYYGSQDESDFDYLTGTDQHKMPARVRFMPIIRPFFDLLKSTQESRPLEPRVYSTDSDSLQDKTDNVARKIVDSVMSATNDAQERVYMLKLSLEEQKAQAQANPGQYRMAEMELAKVQQEVSRGESLINQQVSILEREYRMRGKTRKEVAMTDGLEYLIRKYRWKDIFDEGFQDLMVVDQEVYCIEDVYLGKDPSIRKVNPLNFYYLSSNDAFYTDECPGVVEKRWMTPAQIMDEYGHMMGEEERSMMETRYNATYSFGNGTASYGWYNSNATGSGDVCSPDVYSGSAIYGTDLVEVSVCEWKSVKEIKFVQEDDEMRLVRDEEAHDPEKKYQRRYATEWWGGIRISSDIFVRCGKLPFQFRDIERIGRAYGRYLGFNYNGLDRRPYSRVWAVKDVQILYNLVYYQMELLIALGGIKGVIMDKTQKPKDMSMEEWMYQFKMGLGWIDPTQPGGTGRPSNYNQWMTYDLSFGQSIQQLAFILESLERLAGRVIGIPPQRLGEVSGNDQVGTQKQAIVQSNLTTKVLFNKHQRIVSRVVDRVLSIIPHVWAEGKRGQYIAGDRRQVIFKLSKEELKGAKFECFFDDEDKTQADMDRITQLMGAGFTGGTVTMSQLVDAFRAKNLDELQDKVSYYEEVMNTMQQQNMEQQQRGEQERLKMQSDIDLMFKKQLTDGEALMGQIKQAELQLEQQRIQQEAGVKTSIADGQNQTKLQVANQNAQVEMAFLQEQARGTDLDARIRALEIAIKGGSGNPLSSGRPKNEPSDR